MANNFVSREQLNLLNKRISLAQKTDASNGLYRYLRNKLYPHSPSRILIVGAGGSYPAAVFAKYALGQIFKSAVIDSQTPQTAITSIRRNYYDFVIGISYSGKTPDIKATATICAQVGSNFVLVTGARKEELDGFYSKSDLFKVISYYNPKDSTGKERGMISMASTLIPCIIFDDNGERKLISENQMALLNAESFVNTLDTKNIASLIKRCPIIHVFYEQDTYATALDIESKFTESGVANVILHEKKNFSHGRYTALYNQPFALLINLNRYSTTSIFSDHMIYRTDYDKLLSEFLQNLHSIKAKDAYYLELGTAVVGPAQWNIEALTKIPYLITKIGEELGIDISKPLKPFPEAPLTLYNYKGIF